VRIAVGEEGLEIEVADDGRGVDDAPEGVGVRAMRERAEEVGGDVTIQRGRSGGTVVSARLPVELPPEHRPAPQPRTADGVVPS
jgi:signal transduction histidine kinase